MSLDQICPSCNQRIPEDAGSCPSCGTSLGDSFAATRMIEKGAKPPSGDAKSFGGSHSKTKSAHTPGSIDSIDDARFVPGAMVAERYRIVGLLGKGGMGEVYRADDLKLSQPVALKFLPEQLTDGAAIARFHREVRIARQVSHPNVCRVYDIGEVDGRAFLSMEFIKGEELSSLLRRIGRLPSDKATEIMRQLCAGLAAAHNRGVLHRDLKPANVMIDDNGNVRLTDFGIAGLMEEGSDEQFRAGTPAYMSPEQLAGRELTIKSDIYSLGLVAYELFTGKKVFDAPNLPQLLNLRNRHPTPTTPSSLVQNMDPLVERVILRCLEDDPDRRPASALEVAASLPGGDPLAAALAAGETPSPEMVAAAPRKGFLKPAVAIALLAAVVVGIAATFILGEKAQLHRRVPFEKSPDVLLDRARTVTTKLGYTDAYYDSAFGIWSDFDVLRYMETTPAAQELLASSQPATLFFWYRQSPRYLVPRMRLAVRPTSADPPENVPGMTSVFLDPRGRLLEFRAVPPAVDAPNQSPGAPNWSLLFEEAGLNQATFTSTAPKWLPPVNSDSRAAWEGALPNAPQIPIRIEAAAYAGKPVFFTIVGPWNSYRPTLLTAHADSLVGKILVFLLVVATLGFALVGVLLGRHNLRNGSGDRKGGAKLAIYIFVALMIAWALRANHLGPSEEIDLIQTGVQFALLPAILLWLFYLALEPYVRRWWPHRMVSWSRLLAGDFRDPLIGRDILIGAVFGMAISVVNQLWTLTPGWFGRPQAPRLIRIHTIRSLRYTIGEFFYTGITQIVFLAVICMFSLLLLHFIFRRRDWLVQGVAWLLLTVPLSFSGKPWAISVVYAAICSALVIVAVTRFGLLTLTAAFFFIFMFNNHPTTMDFSVWYASSAIFVLIVTVAVAGLACYTALGMPALTRKQ